MFNENDRVALFRVSNGRFIGYETTCKQTKTTIKAFGVTFSRKTGNQRARMGTPMYKIVKVTVELGINIELSELAKKHINYNCDFSFLELAELGKCINKIHESRII